MQQRRDNGERRVFRRDANGNRAPYNKNNAQTAEAAPAAQAEAKTEAAPAQEVNG